MAIFIYFLEIYIGKKFYIRSYNDNINLIYIENLTFSRWINLIRSAQWDSPLHTQLPFILKMTHDAS